MLPSATQTRSARESSRRKVGGRTHEIQRLIGRSLRAVVNLSAIGERTIHIDCDVIQADGGTRTASIIGAFIALAQLCKKLCKSEKVSTSPITDYIAAVSVGIVDGAALLDLDYAEDSQAEVDANIVMLENEEFIEIQSTAERKSFNYETLAKMIDFAKSGITTLIEKQKNIAGEIVK